MQRYASALVHAGVDPAELAEVSDLVQITRVQTGLRWLRDNRFGGKLTGGLQNIAIAIANAARWHVRVDRADQRKLDAIVKRCEGTERGMTLKNRMRMEPFKDPAVVLDHLRLPQRLIEKANTMTNRTRAAVLAETALAIALLSWCPIRIGNLRAIDLSRNLAREKRHRTARVYLVIPASQVKNGVDIKFELPPYLIELLDHFVRDHRSQLAPPHSRYLFSRRSGDAPIHYNAISYRIKETLRRWMGLDFSSHNFRHLAGLIWLTENPTGFEVVRRLLGHKAASNAMDFYVGLQTDAAHQAFSRLLADFREGRRE